MPTDYAIQLNFLPVTGDIPMFTIHRKVRTFSSEKRLGDEDMRCYSLPITETKLEERNFYWVSDVPKDGFEPFRTNPKFNNHLTSWIFFRGIIEQAKQHLNEQEYWFPERGFSHEIHFNMVHHPEGDEQLIIQPYFLRATQQFGILADFHFRKNSEVVFSRRVQQLSLSLDERYRRNLDYYLARYAKIRTFLDSRQLFLSNVCLPQADKPINLASEFTTLPAGRLRPKSYVFKSGHEARSQFGGLKDYGPLKELERTPKLIFIFRERDRQAARTLAASLKGKNRQERFSFPGFEHLFNSRIDIDPNPIVIDNFSADTMRKALQRIQAEVNLSIPVLIIPDDEEDGYLNHKAVFTNAGIPSQVCTLGVIQNDNTLKWSVANIALQIFCKAGGFPWKVRAVDNRSLIIGISQSHKIRVLDGKNTIEKYFAFSILTDASGLFQKIQVLGESEEEEDYLAQLRTNLKDVLAGVASDFSRVVVHTSFSLKHREIEEIQKVAQDAAKESNDSGCRFAVVKVNHKSKFFGVNQGSNSLVPYEGTQVKLGYGEYLVWFEGIFSDKPTVTKAFPGPTHLQFLHASENVTIGDDILLQDLVNLSGANWRGFNAKSAPVSVFYCHLVADLVHQFQKNGLPLPAVKDLTPWFL